MVSKSELAHRIAARGATPTQAAHAVDAVLDEITAALAAGERVTFVGFGSFAPVARPARNARNPRTGETVPVAATTVPRFHPGAGLKAAVDGGGAPTLGAVGSLAASLAPVVVQQAPATVVEPVKPVKPAKPAKAAKPAKEAKPAKSSKKDVRAAKSAKGSDAKGKKSGKKK
jgi:DNA-binding protein HU-beta